MVAGAMAGGLREVDTSWLRITSIGVLGIWVTNDPIEAPS
jgi:hypothetical protein